MDEILDITLFVAGVFSELGIPYVVGGSLASSLHGIPRATQDADIVANIQRRDVPQLVAAFRETFYLDEHAIQDAVAERTSFNLIHLRSFFKVDIFVARNDTVAREQLRRAQSFRVGGQSGADLVVASPEDVIAHKLYWFSLGDEVSERQWNDAIGVLRVAGARLDIEYLCHAAAMLEVESLLQRACREAGVRLET